MPASAGLRRATGQRRFVHDLDGYQRLLDSLRAPIASLPDAVLGIAPHSLRAVTPNGRTGPNWSGHGPIHIPHIAEQVAEVEDCLAWSGARPVEWLLDHTPVDARWCLVHATHMIDDEASRLAASGAVAGLCPITEANLGDGIFPAEPFLAAGGHLWDRLRTRDVLIDATEELRLLEYGPAACRQGRRNMVATPGGSTGGALYRSALAGGARALGATGGTGTRRYTADFVTLDMDHVSLAGRKGDAILDGLIFAAGRAGDRRRLAARAAGRGAAAAMSTAIGSRRAIAPVLDGAAPA